MPKRKSIQEELPTVAEPSRRRSLRLSSNKDEISTPAARVSAKSSNKSAPTETIPVANGTGAGKDKPPKQTSKRKSAKTAPKAVEESEPEQESDQVKSEAEAEADSEPEPPAKKARQSKRRAQTASVKSKPETVEETAEEAKPAKKNQANGTKKSQTKGGKSTTAKAVEQKDDDKPERNYWLLKAEPETRLENGVDVRFSIDDLAAKTEPEPWDGIRNYVARNNLRDMKKGDLAFFYHSNCKEPGIAGTMEIVQEHSPDLSAHNPKAPYYDAKSKPSDPKWSVVHVEFRSKFAVPIGLKELRTMGDAPGKPLANMQMLKQSRLSVSRVSKEEWEYLIGVAEERGKSITRK